MAGIAVFVLFQSVSAQRTAKNKHANSTKALLGTWHLVRFETVRADGRTFLPFGASVSGSLVYLADGQMIVAYGRQDRTRPQQPTTPTPMELAKMVEGFDAYWGTFEVDPIHGQVVHHVQGAFETQAIGTDRIRSVTLDGYTLVLAVPIGQCWWEFANQCTAGEQVQMKLTWQRSQFLFSITGCRPTATKAVGAIE